MKAFILAAGLGTRLKPLTDTIPKALVEVNGKPLLHHAIEKVKSAGIHEIIINVHHFAEKVTDYINHYNDSEISLTISDESDLLLDTGGAIKKAEWFLKSEQPFLVYNVDILSRINLAELNNYHYKNKSLATLAVSERNSSRYIYFDDQNNLSAWENVITREKKIVREINSPAKYAFSGIYILDSGVYDFMPEAQKFSIIDVFLSAACKQNIKAFIHNPEDILDVGKPDSLKTAKIFLSK